MDENKTVKAKKSNKIWYIIGFLVILFGYFMVSYLLDSPYSLTQEYEINPMDQELGIDWQLGLVGGLELIMSPKDAQAPSLADRLAQGKLPKFFR